MEDKYMDLEEGLARIRGNVSLYKRLLGIFLASPEFDAFEAAIAANDIPQAANVAHGIKGMVGNLSLTALFNTSMTLMNELRQGVLDQNSLAAYRDAFIKTKEEVTAYIAAN